MFRGVALTGAGTGVIAPAPGQLWSVNVTKAGAGVTLTLYNQVDSSTNPIAVVDCANQGSFWFGILCEKGISYNLSGTANVTISFR